MNIDLYALSFATIVFFGGAALTFLFYRLEIKDSATIIALLIAPLLVYGIASGKILELSAPGGWGAKFQEVAQQNVSTTATPLADATPLTQGLDQLQAVEKEGLSKLDEIVGKLQKGKPVALILYFGKQNYYVPNIVKQYIQKLNVVDPDLVIILVDDVAKRFVGAVDANSFLQLSADEAQQLIAGIGNRQRAYLASFPSFVFRGIRDNKTNIEALKEMKDLNTKFLVVLNEKGEPISIVKRDE